MDTKYEPAPFRTESFRSAFPFFQAAGPIFLDSAASTQKPCPVLDMVRCLLEREYASPFRGTYLRASRIGERIERCRAKAAALCGASDPSEIGLAPGSTAAMEFVAFRWGLSALKTGDRMLLCDGDHRSTVFPWLRLRQTLRRLGVETHIDFYRLNTGGMIDWCDVETKLTPRTRVAIFSHVHNVYGCENDLSHLAGLFGSHQALVGIDVAQSLGRVPVDLSGLRADFAVASGHKLFALPGSGLLWCRRGWSENPLHADSLERIDTDWRTSTGPNALESGTPDIAAVLSLEPAIPFVETVVRGGGIDHIKSLTRMAVSLLVELPGIATNASCRDPRNVGIISFTVDNIHPADIATYLDLQGIEVRAGTHCSAVDDAEKESVRASLHGYTTEDDIHRLLSALRDLV